MIGVFVSLDLFLFYVFWDAMLIPMYFLIGIWGYDRRIYAAVKFMLYTMAGSVLMLRRHPRARLRCTARPPAAYSFDLHRSATRCRFRARLQIWLFLAFAWRLRSRCRCFRSTPGCPTRTSRRRPPARSSWPACC